MVAGDHPEYPRKEAMKGIATAVRVGELPSLAENGLGEPRDVRWWIGSLRTALTRVGGQNRDICDRVKPVSQISTRGPVQRPVSGW